MSNHLLNTYNTLPLSFKSGKGAFLFDQDNEPYLDAISGVGATALGHDYPAVSQAIQEQTPLLHVSNGVESTERSQLADLLCQEAQLDKVFFCTSGTEAAEGLIKLARLYAHQKKVNNPKIIVMENAFHGRSMGTISVKGNPKNYQGFEPLLSGFISVPFNDLNAIEQLKQDNNIVAVLLEPIQGEAGIIIPDEHYLAKLRTLCTENSWLMMLDEVQTGIGRTGRLFAFQHTQIQPDAIAIAKGLGNGIPIGAFLVQSPFSDLFHPGQHGATFGGNPFVTRVAHTVVSEIIQHQFDRNAQKQGAKILAALTKSFGQNTKIKEVRGKGLMIAIELAKNPKNASTLTFKHKLLFNVTREKIIRLLPPLILSDEETELLISKTTALINDLTAV